MPAWVVIPRHDLDASAVEERLYEFNKAATGYYDGEDLGFVVEDGTQTIAAAAGYTWGGISEIRYLWVHADHRRRGLGSALMQAAMAEARERGCRLMFLSTHTFQAPDFYLHLGFEIIATIEDKPLGHSEHWMRREL